MFSQLFAIKCLGHFPLNDSGKSSASVPSRLPHHQARSWRSLTWRMGRVRTYESTLKLLGVRESMFNNGTRFFSHGGDIQDLPFLLACTYIYIYVHLYYGCIDIYIYIYITYSVSVYIYTI